VRSLSDQRRKQLLAGSVRGDLMLADTTEDGWENWSLERLHLAEEPPRFPHIHFKVCSDHILPSSRDDFKLVLAILRRFPGLNIRIQGSGHATAPPHAFCALGQARATMVRRLLLLDLQRDPGPCVRGKNPWADEDPKLGVFFRHCGFSTYSGFDEVRGQANLDFYHPQLLGSKIQAIGRRTFHPRNRNYIPNIACKHFCLVEFTIIGIDEPPEVLNGFN
jgi:hypothetical protein